jgi:curli biogenesis system outer membrane secretion channel CsgG
MPPMVTRFVASALLALPLAILACFSARSEPAPAVAAQPTPEAPVKVVVGAYVNDIQELDFKTNSYAIDLYVWFRWKGADLDPSKTMEFMNRYASDANLRDDLDDKPQAMPDGSLYSIIRYQGQFSTKFQLEK